MAQLLAGLVLNQQTQSTPSIPTYHVIPDLSKNIELFSDDGGVRAKEWIENLEAMKRLHQWPDEYLFEAARQHLRGGARDWERCRRRELRTWADFRRAFRETFIVRDDISTRWARMKARVQEKDEALSAYFHAKVKLCSALEKSFRETKSELLIGLWSRDLCNAVMPTTQYTYDELYHDLVYYANLLDQRVERIRASKEKPKPTLNTPKNGPNRPDAASGASAMPIRIAATGRSPDSQRK